jgi:hypothetical protein
MAAAKKLAPTALGRRILKLIAEQRHHHDFEWDDDDDPHRLAWDALNVKIVEIGDKVCNVKRPSLGNLVDRAILAVWSGAPRLNNPEKLYTQDDGEGFVQDAVETVIEWAGLQLWQCNICVPKPA